MREAPRVSSLQACAVTRDAARSAANVLFVSTGSYPTTFTAMTSGKSPALVTDGQTTVAAHAINGKGWKLTMSGGGTTPSKLICANAPAG